MKKYIWSYTANSRIQEAPIQSHRVFRKIKCMQSQCPAKTERHIFRSQPPRRIYKFVEGGGVKWGWGCSLSLVRKAGLGATLKIAQNDPFRVISPTRGGGQLPPPSL